MRQKDHVENAAKVINKMQTKTTINANNKVTHQSAFCHMQAQL